MKMLESISTLKLIEQAHVNSKYNTKKSKLNKKWVRFLKNKKLFDEYMVYLGNHDAIGVEPKTYKQISNVCHNLANREFGVRGSRAVIRVDWVSVFKQFCDETIKWYDLKNTFLYIINNGYE